MSKTGTRSPLPEAGEGKRGEDGHFGYLLRQAANAHRYRVEQALADLGVTHPQFSVMTMLDAYPGHSNADLARLALLTPQTMSVIVANLLKSGIVERRAHEVHGRIQHLALSDHGRQLLTEAKKRVYGLEEVMLADVPLEARATIKSWLAKVAKGGDPTSV